MWGALLAVVALVARVTTGQEVQFGQTYDSGQATFYTLTQAGNCAFETAGTKHLPWASGIQTFVAMNQAQYDGSVACGLCLQYMGDGQGLGLTPIPTTPQYALVSDQVRDIIAW